MTAPQEILVRGPNWTGDWIMASPGFRALRAGYPESRITLQVRPELAPLAAGAPWFDAVWPLASYGRGPRALLREGLALRRQRRFDLGICLPDSVSAALLMRAAGVRRIVGYRRGWRRPLLHRAVELPRPRARRLLIARERYVLGLLEALGCPARGTSLELFVTAAEEEAARVALQARGVAPERPLAVLAPGASFGPSKLWPDRSFAAVGDALERAGLAVAVVGTPGERPLAAAVCAAMTRPAADLAGALDLGGLKALVRSSRLLVCNDAGARHVAVAFGVPCIVTMGPTALEKTDMNLERVSVLSADVECRPCYRRTCPIDHRCMERIPAEAVVEEALRALGSVEADGFQGRRLLLGAALAGRA